MDGVSDHVTQAAMTLAEKGASRGGVARAQRLTPEQRQESSRKAAEARWGRRVLPASHEGELIIGNRVLACAVLDDGTRVISQGTLLETLGRSRRPKSAEGGGTVLFAANLQPFVSPELDAGLSEAVSYRTLSGVRALGYRAELLPQVCEVYLDAQQAGRVMKSQREAAAAAWTLLRGLARVGIIALIDEATGYQEVRARRELEQILERYVLSEFRPWIKTFPDEFFQEVYRLQGWEYKPGTSKRTPYVGYLINKYIYDQLPPGVHDELTRLNPRRDSGSRQYKHHQFLTVDTGHPHLDRQLAAITTLMRSSTNKTEFERLFERAFPPAQMRLPMVIDVPEDEG